MLIQILLFPGFDELDALAPYEVFQNATLLGADIETALVTQSPLQQVAASHGTRVLPAGVLGKPDLLVIPGGGWGSHAPYGVRAEVQQGALPAAIAHLYQTGTTLAAVCTGALLVSAAGLLKGRPATTHHNAIEDLRAAGAQIVSARVVDDGAIVTSGGVTSSLDLALWLVERSFGPQMALAVEQNLEYERRGTVWRRSLPAEHTL